jgi:hypothetical protein
MDLANWSWKNIWKTTNLYFLSHLAILVPYLDGRGAGVEEGSGEGQKEIRKKTKQILVKKKDPSGFEPETSRSAVECSTTELWIPLT